MSETTEAQHVMRGRGDALVGADDEIHVFAGDGLALCGQPAESMPMASRKQCAVRRWCRGCSNTVGITMRYWERKPAPDSELMKAAKALVEASANLDSHKVASASFDQRDWRAAYKATASLRRMLSGAISDGWPILARLLVSGAVTEAQVRAASGEGA